MPSRIQLRRDTAANWTAINPVLAQGEPGLDTTIGLLKFGDGITAWNSLPYSGVNPSAVGNIIPALGNVYTLGNATNTWKSLYVSGNVSGNAIGNGIFLGNIQLGSNATQLLVNGNAVAIDGANVSFDDITAGNINTTGDISAGNLDITNDAIIGGNLTVSGNTIYNNVTSFNVEDPIIGLGRAANNQPLTTNDGKDRGEQLWYFSGSEKSAFTGYDNSTGKITLATDVTIASEVVSYNNYGNTVVGNLEGAGVSVTGNITAGNITTAGLVSAAGGVYGNIVGPIPASSNILYVAKNGSDSNTGGLNTPFLTIKAALAAATSGTSVHVAPGTYTEANPVTIPANVALMGDNLRSVTVIPQTPASNLFYMTNGSYVWGITIKNYTANGFSYNPATASQNVYVSPYIQNITSSTTTGTAVYIDGDAVSSVSTKAMIVGFFTIINQGGRGIHIANSGYSQLVNIYTIACDIGVKVESGGFCTLNGSDCSIGNYGLIADGVGPLQTSGNTVGYSTQGVFVLNGLTNGQPHVNTVMKIAGDPEYYTIDIIAPNIPSVGSSTVYIQQTYTANLAPSTNVEFYTRSSIIASAHTFEYVGAGTNPATALPQYGGIPIEANEVVMANGGVVTFTSTDQKGSFKVGQGFTINQATGTITGTYFYQSLFAQMTPYILALSP